MTESGEVLVYVQELEPVAGSLGLSALVAALSLVIVLVLLGGVRTKAHLAGVTGLPTAALVALGFEPVRAASWRWSPALRPWRSVPWARRW